MASNIVKDYEKLLLTGSVPVDRNVFFYQLFEEIRLSE